MQYARHSVIRILTTAEIKRTTMRESGRAPEEIVESRGCKSAYLGRVVGRGGRREGKKKNKVDTFSLSNAGRDASCYPYVNGER